MKTCGEVLVEILAAYGIDTVFGIPGVHTVELYRGLPASRIRHVTPRHEQGAGFMADGYARASGRPAACFIITGPGMTNIATALGQAFADSVPVLVISSVNATHELGLGEGRLHELPSQRDLVAGVTVFSQTVLRPDELPGLVARAFAVFNSSRPGPVHLELPLDVITASGDHLSTRPHATRARPAPDPEAIAAAARLLGEAKSPMVVLGGGTQDAANAARILVDKLQALTAVTINAKGVLPPSHPFSVGSMLPQKPILDALQAADVVLAVGTELSETDTLLFMSQLKVTGKLIRIDIDPQQLVRNVLPEIAICADAALALGALAAALPDPEGDGTPVRRRVQELKAVADSQIPEIYHPHRALLEAIDKALPGAIIVGDSTQPIYGANLFYEPQAPRSYFNSSTGYGTLGFALPAALGAKLGESGRPVVAIIGDGGLQFTINELATGVELGLGLPIILWNNRGYSEIKKYMAERNIPQIGVDIYTPDFQTIAKGFGCRNARARDAASLASLLAEAHAAEVPTVIEIDEADTAGW